MPFYADLHIHSKYSRATSRDCDLEHLSLWAQKKGIAVVGSGDLSHPAWRAELREKLVAAEPGLFRLRPELETEVAHLVPPACRAPVRFMLSGEISTIYKKGERTRKVHHVIYTPDLDSADRLAAALARVGNIASDGRPILGLDSRHLLEMVLEAGEGAFLVPAHIWTPWFSVLGSRSGFDSVDECYGDLAGHIFALETGLSSDPEMNWRVSSLDRFRLVSNSDAHSPAKLGREATIFDCAPDYFAMRRALETGDGYRGTVEFFPEEGKYHLDGHRKCHIRLSPEETRRHHGRCPVCGEPVTVGVMHRVAALADRPEGAPPVATAGEVRSLVPLPEILAEIAGVAPSSKSVQRDWEKLLSRLGPELAILDTLPPEAVSGAGSSLLAEALTRLRRGEVRREAGYDGEYGAIKLFAEGELTRRKGILFDLPEGGVAPASLFPEEGETAPPPAPAPRKARRRPTEPVAADTPPLLAGLDPEQRAAALVSRGPLLIVAGPGSGKTRTLTHRIAHLIQAHGVPPAATLAVTFTRRAAAELRRRLAQLLPEQAAAVPVHTFHSLGLELLRADPEAAGLAPDFALADEGRLPALLQKELGLAASQAQRLLRRIGKAKCGGGVPEPALAELLERYHAALRREHLVDFDDLVGLAVELLAAHPGIAERWRLRFPWISIDEYQDVDPRQYRLVRLLAPGDANLCAIGDPDQAIYGFRGAEVAFFHRFREDYPTAEVAHLTRNYRSGATIVEAAGQVILSGNPGHRAQPTLLDDPHRIAFHDVPSEAAEAAFVVATVESLVGGASFHALDSGRAAGGESDLAFADFAVLARTEALLGPAAEALARAGIPYQRRGHDPLAATPGVAELMAAMAEQATGDPLAARLKAAALRLAAAAGEHPERFHTAADLLLPLASRCGGDLGRLHQELALTSEADTWDPRAQRVSLLTLHAAKGLEFPVVILLACEEGILPLTWGEQSEAEREEERRLFYVGMTRAGERLILSRARRRLWRGQVREMNASPFLHDIETRLTEQRRAKAKKRKAPEEGGTQLALF